MGKDCGLGEQRFLRLCDNVSRPSRLARLSHLSRRLSAWAILRRPFGAGIEEIFSLCSNHRAVRSFVIPVT